MLDAVLKRPGCLVARPCPKARSGHLLDDLHGLMRDGPADSRDPKQLGRLKAFVRVRILDEDAQQVVGSTENPACLNYLIERRDLRLELLNGVLVVDNDLDRHRHLEATASGAGVDPGVIASDNAVLLEPLDSTQARRRGETHPM